MNLRFRASLLYADRSGARKALKATSMLVLGAEVMISNVLAS